MSANTPRGPIVTTDNPRRLSPIEAAVMDWCNHAHRIRERGDSEELQAVADELHRLLDRYDATDGDGHEHPAWARPNQRALVQSALGQVEAAVQTEQIALRYANTPRRVEVSAGNIADRLLRMDDPRGALPFFFQAWDAAPYSVPVMMTGARILHRLDRLQDADAVLAQLLELTPLLDGGSDLAVYLRHEHELGEMAPDLPALRDLFAWLDTLGGAS
jgi:hypothetical protein